MTIVLTGFAPKYSVAVEVQYQYFYASQSYSTLAAAEAAMRSVDPRYQFLEQTGYKFNQTTGFIEYSYSVPDRPAIQVGPTIYWGHNAPKCVSSYCYSEDEAYAEYKKYQEDTANHCNAVITPLGDWSSESFGKGSNLNEGQQWPDGTAYTYKMAQKNFQEDYGLISQGACTGAYSMDWLIAWRWKPWGCADGAYFHPVSVNTTYDTCRIIAPVTTTITAKPAQFPGCGSQTAHPIRTLTGEKVLSQLDIDLSDIKLSRYYHSSGQTFTNHTISPGWQHNYHRHLILNTSSEPAFAVRENGDYVRLRSLSSTLYVSAGQSFVYVEKLTGAYRLTLPSGEVENYTSDGGYLTSIQRPNGQTITVGRYPNNAIYSVASTSGQSLTFAYDADGNLSTITDHTGRIWIYGYDAQGNLATVQYPDNSQIQYHYEDARYPNFVTGVTDRRDIRYSTFAYDDKARAQTSYLGAGIDRIDVVYGSNGVQAVTNTRGAQTTYAGVESLGTKLVSNVTGPGCSGCGTSNTSYTYDASNNVLSKTENGVTTRYGNYDNKGQYGCKVEGVSAADTTTGVCAFNATVSPDARRTDYTYDARFYHKITTLTEPSVAPGQNKFTSYTYDDWGNRLTETIAGFKPDGTPVSRTTTWQYNGPLHQLSQVDGPRTDVADITTYDYYPDDAGQGANRARLRRVTDATGVALRDNIQYTATGKVLSESRPNGLTLSYTYYPGNDRLQTLTESASAISRVTRWTYLATGEVETITQADGTADATTLTFGYDDARRLTRLTDGLGNYIAYQLDTEGNREYERVYDNTGALKKQLHQTFDLYNRLDTTDQANETTNPTYAPDGTLDNSTDGRGIVTDYSYDALKRLTQTVQDQNGTDAGSADATTQYDYDTADRLTSVTDPVNGNTLYVYDDLGNRLSQTSPDTGTTTFGHDSAGNVTARTDAKGQVFGYAYDALNRLTFVDAPGLNDDVTYTYDTCGNGRLCRISNATATVEQRYNAFGELTGLPGLTYTYDAAGRVKTLTYPSGAQVTYGYDAAGRVGSVSLTVNGVTQTLASNLAYAPFGPLTGLAYGNGMTLTQTVDTAYRLTAQSIPGVLSLTYPTYDANGNLTTRTDGGQPEGYTYDALNRLDTATGPFGPRDYGYDKNGNRTLLDGTSYTYTPNSNRLDSIGSTDVLLDANGNTLNKGSWTFDYNAHNRLTASYDNGTLAANYAYNGLGQRVSKTKPDTTGRHFLYGQNGELLAETDADGNLLNEYVYLNGQPLAVYQPDDDNDGLSNAEEDPLGSNPANTDSDGDGLSNIDEWYSTGTDARLADTDGDGVLDGAEIAAGTDPNNATAYPGDGDINQDGQVNAGDLVLMVQFVTGSRVPTAEQLTHADMHTDGVIDVRDMLKLQRRILGLTLREWFNELPGAQRMQAAVVRAQRAVSDVLAHAHVTFIDNAQAAVANGKLYYVHVDHLGTPKVLTDEAGVKVWSATHDPFGQATVNEDPDGNGQAVTFNLRYAGQYADNETGLHQNGFRTYGPSTGRYLESDPIGLGGGLNTYVYASSNPIMRIDPPGLVDWEGTFGGIAAIDGVGAGFFRFDLTSECKCGRRIRIKGYASTVAVGLGFKYTGSGSAASFFDTNSCPDASAANGVAVITAVSSVPGGGFSISKSQLGDLNSSPPRRSGPVYGLDISIGAYVGASVVTDYEILECCDSQ